MKKSNVIWTLLAITLIAGCANTETMLRNDKGEVRYCYLVHDSTLARVPAVAEYNRCLNEAGSAGFRKVQ